MESGRNPESKKHIQPEYRDWVSKLTRDGTAESVSRGQSLRHKLGQGLFFPVELTYRRIGNNARLLNSPVKMLAQTHLYPAVQLNRRRLCDGNVFVLYVDVS